MYTITFLDPASSTLKNIQNHLSCYSLLD